MVANPLPFLLAEEAHGDHQATQALFLTFNADLGFFEARALGACLSAGARVCVLADASVWRPDPRAAKHAGRSYHVGLTTVHGAFHPKLVALVGPQRAVVAIGSGNLTLGGWQHNGEVWTVFHADLHQAPSALMDLPAFLRDITKTPMDEVARRGVERTAQELEGLLGRSEQIHDTGHRILTSLQGPIVDALPEGPTCHLWLYAPFHDPAARGVAALVDRLRPDEVTVLVQPGFTVIEPGALERVLNSSSVAAWEVVQDAELNRFGNPRYRHGKLIEWTTPEGARFAVTGSPNLSYAALAAAAGRGNTELAILSPLAETLFPTGTPLDLTDVPAISIPSPDDQVAGTTDDTDGILLAAVLDQDNLHIYLNGPLKRPRELQISTYSNAPDDWEPWAQVPAGRAMLTLSAAALTAGSRVRLMPAEGSAQSPLVYVTDRQSVEHRRVTESTSRTAHVAVTDMWGLDPRVLNALSQDLADLAADTRATKAPPAPHSGEASPEGDPTGSRETDADKAVWLWHVGQSAENHGAQLSAFGLALPTPPASTSLEHPPGWEDQLIGDEEVSLEEDTAEAVDDESIADNDQQPSAVPTHRNDAPDLRRRRRQWCKRWALDIDTVPVTSRLIVIRLFLILWTAGNWDDDDPEPHILAAALLGHLAAVDTQGDNQLEDRLANMAMVGLQVMLDRVDVAIHDEATIRYTQLREQLRHLALGVDTALLSSYCEFLTRPSGWPLTSDVVLGLTGELLDENPFADATAALEERGYTVFQQRSGMLRIDGTYGNPERVAIEAASLADHDRPLGIWAVNQHGAWALALWERPDLITVTTAPPAPSLWQHRRLPPHLGPSAAIDNPASRFRVRHGPAHQPFKRAKDLLHHFGLDDPAPQ